MSSYYNLFKNINDNPVNIDGKKDEKEIKLNKINESFTDKLLEDTNEEKEEFEIHGTLLVKYNGDGYDVEIPNNVRRISSAAFKGKDIFSITIPSTVDNFDGAFENQESLQEVTILSKVVSTKAFKNCENLQEVNFGPKVERIALCAFQGCSALTDIDIPGNIKSIDELAFNGCRHLYELTLQEGVEYIGRAAFASCGNLKRIQLPNSLKTIDSRAFADNYRLTSFRIPDGVTTLGNELFNGCLNLETIEVPNSVKSFGGNVFGHCGDKLTAKDKLTMAIFGEKIILTCHANIITENELIINYCKQTGIKCNGTLQQAEEEEEEDISYKGYTISKNENEEYVVKEMRSIFANTPLFDTIADAMTIVDKLVAMADWNKALLGDLYTKYQEYLTISKQEFIKGMTDERGAINTVKAEIFIRNKNIFKDEDSYNKYCSRIVNKIDKLGEEGQESFMNYKWIY